MPTHRNKPRVTAIGMTDPGSRNHNEDGFLSIQGTYQHIFAVCDGMGGHAAGEIASAMAVEALKRAFVGDKDAEQPAGTFLAEAINDANYSIFQDGQDNPERSGMGSTCVVGLVRGNKLSVGHVGDSRAYLIRGGGIRQLTRDHSFVEEMVKAGMITPHEAHSNPQRNVILQSLGRGDGVNVDVAAEAVNLKANDYVLLCSDGLTAVVADQEIAETVERLGDPKLVSEELIDLTNRRGGPDNVTVVCVRYDGEATEGPPIAIVCDDANSTDLYRLVLQRDGYSIELHNTLNAVLDFQIDSAPRLVILEHNDDAGVLMDICRELRAEPSLAYVPLLIVSDEIGEEDSKEINAQVLPSSKLLTELVSTVRHMIERVSPRIYTLDPNAEMDADVEESLRQEGFVVRSFPSLELLQSAISDLSSHLVLLQITDDVEYVCAALREHAIGCPIVLTAQGAVSDAREAYAVGADYYLTRSKDVASLARMLIQK